DIEPDKHNMDRAENIRIEDCLIRNNQGNGILVYHRVSEVVITGCQIERNDGFGILTIGTKAGNISANRIGHNRLDGLSISVDTRDYAAGGNYFRNNTTRNHGIVGASLAWSATNWSRMTGQVSGRNGTQSHLGVSDTASNIRINANFYSK
ncbi:right-handed parallel beta-helix repeat-containing protein, partial [Lysobacter erysipheiresistens]